MSEKTLSFKTFKPENHDFEITHPVLDIMSIPYKIHKKIMAFEDLSMQLDKSKDAKKTMDIMDDMVEITMFILKRYTTDENFELVDDNFSLQEIIELFQEFFDIEVEDLEESTPKTRKSSAKK